jgi:tRNA (guanine-N7-)-methyltransferase
MTNAASFLASAPTPFSVSSRGVDTPTRTAEFLVRRDNRRANLRHHLAELLAAYPCITLEIGAGHGHFLTEYAKAHPDEFCVGIDLLRDRVDRALRKRDRAKLANLVFLKTEAAEFIAALPPQIVLQRIFVLFPDPWPKRRHHKNRLMQADFLRALAARSKPGTELCFRTDDPGYFAAAQAVVQTHRDWEVASAPWPFERETVFQSRAPAYQSLVTTRRIVSS